MLLLLLLLVVVMMMLVMMMMAMVPVPLAAAILQALHSPKVARAERADAATAAAVTVFLRVAIAGLRSPAVAAGKNLLDALVGGELGGQPSPRGGERATIEVLDLSGVPRFVEARNR
jgi:ABC-type sulfate transport system permease component